MSENFVCRSSLIWVKTVCYRDVLKGPADDTQQTTLSRDKQLESQGRVMFQAESFGQTNTWPGRGRRGRCGGGWGY